MLLRKKSGLLVWKAEVFSWFSVFSFPSSVWKEYLILIRQGKAERSCPISSLVMRCSFCKVPSIMVSVIWRISSVWRIVPLGFAGFCPEIREASWWRKGFGSLLAFPGRGFWWVFVGEDQPLLRVLSQLERKGNSNRMFAVCWCFEVWIGNDPNRRFSHSQELQGGFPLFFLLRVVV